MFSKMYFHNPDEFDPFRIHSEYLKQIGGREMLLELSRAATSVCVPGYEFSNANESRRIEAARRLSAMTPLANALLPRVRAEKDVGFFPNIPAMRELKTSWTKLEAGNLVQQINVIIYYLFLGQMIDYEEMHGEEHDRAIRSAKDSAGAPVASRFPPASALRGTRRS